MRISEILQRDALSLSFEVFPPKTTSAFAGVKAATEAIAALGPAFVSVTYGAGGGTRSFVRRTSVSIYAGVVPQQPPARRTPSRIRAAVSAANSSGGTS